MASNCPTHSTSCRRSPGGSSCAGVVRSWLTSPSNGPAAPSTGLMPATSRCSSTPAAGDTLRGTAGRFITTVACPPGAGMSRVGSCPGISVRSSAFMEHLAGVRAEVAPRGSECGRHPPETAASRRKRSRCASFSRLWATRLKNSRRLTPVAAARLATTRAIGPM